MEIITPQLILIMSVLLRCLYTDMKKGKIENKVILIATLLGIMLNYVTGGFDAVVEGVKMAGIIIALLYALFLIKGLGAGDIKLLSLIGLLFPKHAFMITALSFILAAALALIRIIIRLLKKEKALVRGETIHFSIPIALACILVVIVKEVI